MLNSTQSLKSSSANNSVLRIVKMLVFFMLALNLGILAFLFNGKENQISLNIESIEYHLATENNAVKLVTEIKNSQLLLDELEKEKANHTEIEIERKLREILENLRHNVDSRIDLIVFNHQVFKDPYFDSAIARLTDRAKSLIIYIDNHKFTQFELDEINMRLKVLIIAANQIEGLHETAFHSTQAEAERLNNSNLLIVVILVTFGMLLALITTRIGLSHIRVALRKQQQAKEEVDKINNELEYRVQARTQELENSNERLKTSLSQLKRAQNQLVQSEKMASLGNLVAGVAHEINTPIGVGLSAISHLAMKLENHTQSYKKGELTKEEFEDLLKVSSESCAIVQLNLERAAQLIKSFKQVSVDQSQDRKRRINMKSYLENIYTSLKPSLQSKHHSVKIDCAADIELTINPGALSQVISNLIVNSLSHGFENIDDGEISITVEKQGDHVRLVYGDDGVGIPDNIGEKIFEPFFTTKRESGGSGLGMHIVYNLVTQSMEGSIKLVQENAQNGACFLIKLPTGNSPHQSLHKRSA